MKQSAPQKIKDFLSDWRMATFPILRNQVFKNQISEDSLSKAIFRLQQQGELQSVRVGNQHLYFDRLLKKRSEALIEKTMKERLGKISSWGIRHHFKILEIGLQLKDIYPALCIKPNLFSDHVSFSLGSFGRGGKKYAPDLILSTSNLESPRSLYIEVERTVKKKTRYDERWLAFENDPHVSGCLYWLDDFFATKRLLHLAKNYFLDGRARPSFFLGFLNAAAPFLNDGVSIYSSQGQKVSNLNNMASQLALGKE